jgi:hypothetical protein
MWIMSVNQLIRALQSLPANVRKLPAVSYEGPWLVEVEKPRVSYRDKRRVEVRSKREGTAVVVL